MDRAYPLDTVTLLTHRAGQDGRAPEYAVMHTGPFADEMTRAAHALAITEGADIYLRSGAYQNAGETGRAVLAHELTHARQYEDRRFDYGADTETLEQEAEAAESQAVYDDDPVVEIKIPSGETFKMRKSALHTAKRLCVEKVREWLLLQKEILKEDEYLRLLERVTRL
jgi:hypothetical protein